MKIIDAHVHVGLEKKTNILMDAQYIVQRMKKYRIEKSIIFAQREQIAPFFVEQNNYVYQQYLKFPEKLIPFYFFLPLKECFIDLQTNIKKWSGIKLYPNYESCLLSSIFNNFIDLIKQHPLPIIIHSDSRISVQNELIEFLSKIGTENKIIISHGLHLSYQHILKIANMTNVFLDISPWVAMMRFSNVTLVPKNQRPFWYVEDHDVNNFMNLYELVSGRILWGSDLPDNSINCFGAEVNFLKNLPSNIMQKIYKNTLDLFS